MQLLPIHTRLIGPGDDLAALLEEASIQEGDIIAVSSKAVATAEGNIIDLESVTPSFEALAWTERLVRTKRNPAFREAVLRETQRLHGTVLPSCSQAMLTDIRPDGMENGRLLVPNAGLDLSNIGEGKAVGWPVDPVASVCRLRMEIERIRRVRIAVVLTDSACRPGRQGVTALALTVSGMDPVESHIGRKDLFGKALQMTQEARADQIATAANMLMGNADQSIPAVIVRDHGFPFSDFEGWVPGIAREDDLFQGAF